MIFEELVLTNVGPFRGEHHIALTPASPEQPVVLFGGLNGAGKTTLLESLLLALYGPYTPAGMRRATGYEKYLDQLINHDADKTRGAQVELSFRAVHQGRWQTLKIARSWSVIGERVREAVSVARDGTPDPTLASSWTDYVETLAPRGVAKLFFFDGEQIEAFADLEEAKKLVSTAISGLLGLDLVDRLRDDLLVLERRKRQEASEGEQETEFLKSQQRVLERVQVAETKARIEVENAEREAKEAQQRADHAAERLAREGGERYQVAEEVRGRAAQAQESRAREHKTLIEALAGLGPLALVEPLLERTVEQAVAEQHQADNQTMAALLAERDTQLLELLRGQRATAEIQQMVTQFLTEDLERRKTGDGVPQVLGTNAHLVAFAQRLLAAGLAEERAELYEGIDQLTAAQAAMDDADRAAAFLQQDWAVEHTLDDHRKAVAALASAQARWQTAERDLRDAISQRQVVERTIEREFRTASTAQLKSQEGLRIVEYSARARETLAKLRAAATQQHVKRIEALILDSLHSLLRKENLISDVKINPENCAVELLTHNGRPVRPSALSAGERQLLAVSLLAGLARASGRMLPVVIDTPLGRLDQDHRKRLIQRYLPHASHQVIVLSTDTEITPQVLGKLGDSISHMIKLEHDPDSRSSVVREGYFALPEPDKAIDDEDDEEPS
jgi:DNA sulfur modification protein DndD